MVRRRRRPRFRGRVNHPIHVTESDNKQFVVMDGEEGKQHDNIGQPSIAFSPDGKHVAHAAKWSGKWTQVVDGKEEMWYDGITTPAFSPNSKHLAYGARWIMNGLSCLREPRGHNMTSSLMGKSSSIPQVVSITSLKKVTASIWWKRVRNRLREKSKTGEEICRAACP